MPLTDLQALGKSLRAEEAVPLYERVKRQLSERILVGAWPPGTIVPSEAALAASMGIAVGTVRRALAELAAEGLVARRRKTGTVVTGRKPHHSLRMTFQYFRLHGKDETLHKSTPEIVGYEQREPTDIERAILGLGGGSAVHHLLRVRLVERQPVMYDDIVIPVDVAPHLLENGALPQSYTTFLLDRYGVRISAMREKITAELATDQDRDILGVEHPSAVLAIDETAFDQTGRPVLRAIHRAITRDFMYLNEIS